ncbi:MAG: phosphatidylglycerol lysyltransferase domain-containing protein [Candidatus Saccharibacteria bacterium]
MPWSISCGLIRAIISTRLLVSVPQIAGLGFTYLGTLLLRRKYTAWLAAMVLFALSFLLEAIHFVLFPDFDAAGRIEHLMLPVLIVALLWLSRSAFQVRSDVRSFTQAARVSVLVLLVAFAYGVGGFTLLDDHDFHHEIGLPSAMHQTVDQFGLTDDHAVAYTRRARLFVDSLSVLSVAAVGYAAISLFQPIRMRLVNQTSQRDHAERLLREYPSDIDDFFKLWPHDKLYYFDKSGEAALAYHVSRGVALVVGNPFGEPKRFAKLTKQFTELCFVNDWLPAFIHVDASRRKLYEKRGFRLQKIGEEAVLDLAAWPERQTGKSGKYFREIRNRFTKLGYSVEIVQPPHSQAILNRLREISDQWLEKPGRSERGFMLGYHNDAYFQQAPLALVRDEALQIQGFINMVPTFALHTANYDLLRCSAKAPGNCNDFLLMGLLDHLLADGCTTFNLGLSPLAGLDDPVDSKDKTLVDNALRFVYSNGDRLYSFSGLHRFKDKYKPDWQDRYIAYPGGVRNFTRILTALNRAMKVK